MEGLLKTMTKRTKDKLHPLHINVNDCTGFTNKYIHYYDKYEDSNKFSGLIYEYDFNAFGQLRQSYSHVAERIITAAKFDRDCKKRYLNKQNRKVDMK